MNATKSRKHSKSKKKDSQLIIRISKEERDAFVDLCDHMDTSAAREVRHFIRGFLASHSDASTVEPQQPEPDQTSQTEPAPTESI